MKPIEDVFSSDVLRRVVLPGIVLSVGFHPFIAGWIPTITSLYGIGSTAVIVAEVLVFGIVISSATNWIYYVYEGYRLEWLTFLGWQCNRVRVRRCKERLKQIYAERDFNALTPSDQASVLRLNEYLLDFPFETKEDGSVERFVERPTRLGNIIATYEMYAQSRYGIDGTEFWYHLLNLASDTSRKSFEDAYSFAESLVLASFAGAIVAILHLFALFGFAVGSSNHSLVLLHLSSGPLMSGCLVLFGSFIWLMFYKMSLSAHRDAGYELRAIVDAVLPKFLEWAVSVQVPPPDDIVTKVRILNEYLKYLDRPDVTPPNSHKT